MRTLLFLVLICPLLGCAISPAWKEAILDPGKQQRERKEEIKRLVEHRHQQAHLQAAAAMLDEGRYDDCLRVLDSLAKSNPDAQEVQLLRAEVRMSQSQYPAAAAIYEELLQKNPSDANLHHLHAMALEFSGDTTSALVAFQRAAELSPDSNVIQMSQLPQPTAGMLR
ncbi:hypothetical protein DTL42_19915 [Bremerella cremea]|uniref:Tetratricopeptide repeat protein n=1 Tax=Bremerella cremea TaxID=1031537 RepID=A0A368KLK6_9BACT|nr:tetratricopeptide repeat protein [Bremerella cremea]RCS42098.1 hypothetical protein DTL42_19915 [Bremerella cremea]